MSGTDCTVATDCPPGEGCCGNGIRDIGETCDLGLSNCPAQTLCAAGCTAECKQIGVCPSTQARCVTASDCSNAEGCCGNRTVDAGTNETCDDGNTVEGVPDDFCPADCHVDSCTATPNTFTASITFSAPGKNISGLGVFVDYPEGQVGKPSVAGAFGVSSPFSDLTYGLIVEAIKLGALPTKFATLTFKTCQDAGPPVAADFKCKVNDASDSNGDNVDPSSVTCAVSVP
jgi:hypothetical protein